MDADEIRARLAAKGLNQIDLAAALGIHPNKVSKSLSGLRRFTADERDKIRDLLEDDRPVRSIPVLGDVPAGNWREAVRNPLYSMPAPDPSVPPRAFGLRVQGDSMDKLVEDGGTIVVDPDDKALFPGRYYVIVNAEGETTFKQFQADPARLVPCSTNDLHGDQIIGGETFQVVGRIIWRAARM